MTPLMHVKGLSAEFRTARGAVHAVNDVSFDIESGETLGVVGESGSGKSVTFLSILRLLSPRTGFVTAGSIDFGGEDLVTADDATLRRVRGNRIAMVFQDPMTSLNPTLTIGTQIMEVLQLHQGLGKKDAKLRAAELLTLVNIPGSRTRLRSYPHELSGGMRQRVMIAMGLACTPDLLIADEPTTALDVTVQAQIVRLITELRESTGMSVVWITHDLALLAGIADRIQVMYAGRIVEEARVEELYANPRHPYTQGLLSALPSLAGQNVRRLRTIPGVPPDLIDYPSGCPFAARCPSATEQCHTRRPQLETVGDRHRVACWVKPERTAS